MRMSGDTNEVVSISDSLTAELVEPPADRMGICPRCRTWSDADPATAGGECENCREVRAALAIDPLRFAVVSLYSKPSDLRDWLTRYKGREHEVDSYEPAFVPIVRSIVGRFVIEHGAALEEHAGGFDAIVVVPSTTRPAPHPLEAVIESLGLDVPLMRLLERGPGDLAFRRPAADGYIAVDGHPPARALLIDDVYTTGSRLNSAAAALRKAGHQVTAALVLARRINVDYNERSEALWCDATARPFDWKTSPWLPT